MAFYIKIKSDLSFEVLPNTTEYGYTNNNGNGLTHSHTMTPFDAPWETSLLKTLWEKRNCS